MTPTPGSRTAFLASGPADLDALLGHALELGSVNLKVMAMLDGANTGSFGNPVPTQVRVTPVAGKAILVSGHDLHDLDKILQATAGTGINVYTHGELLPHTATPNCTSTPTCPATTAVPGRTSSAISPPSRPDRHDVQLPHRAAAGLPQPDLHLGPVGWPGVRHVDNDDLSLVIKAAQASARLHRGRPRRDGHHRLRAQRGAVGGRHGDRGGQVRRHHPVPAHRGL